MDNNKIESLLIQIQSQISQMQSDITDLKEGQSQMQSDIICLKEGQSRIEDKLEDMDARNATNHTKLLNTFETISEDIDFITHKESITEKEVFTIKKKLEIIK